MYYHLDFKKLTILYNMNKLAIVINLKFCPYVPTYIVYKLKQKLNDFRRQNKNTKLSLQLSQALGKLICNFSLKFV